MSEPFVPYPVSQDEHNRLIEQNIILTARLAEAVAAARFYARYYDGPSEALLGEADRMAFQWIESDANEVKP